MVVLSNNDGCVIARSQRGEALRQNGRALFQAKDMFRRHGIIAFSSNYELYADMSNRVMTTLEELSHGAKFTALMRLFAILLVFVTVAILPILAEKFARRFCAGRTSRSASA